ncbi:DUF5682 family protein, partial [Streptomyces sp. NPDC059783]|uniref:DUF5682 family protein n=1 Tax=Streptomyces sp. NPDC059783 TaxID=3346944 RepID=UPI003647D0DC
MSQSLTAGPAVPEAAVAALAATGPGAPFLIGVRHHAPSLAAALPALLDQAAPDVLLVELPGEFQPWLGLLAHEETRAPVALAAVPATGAGPGTPGERGPAFYPFADFSPELVALRWAARNGVPAVACDLPLADRAWAEGGSAAPAPSPAPETAAAEGDGLTDALRSGLTGRDGDDLWDRLVEAHAPGSAPESIRRAALLTGWALRREAEARDGVSRTDRAREARMRRHIAEALADGRRPAVVVGAFHTPALLPAGTDALTPASDGPGTPAYDVPGTPAYDVPGTPAYDGPDTGPGPHGTGPAGDPTAGPPADGRPGAAGPAPP